MAKTTLAFVLITISTLLTLGYMAAIGSDWAFNTLFIGSYIATLVLGYSLNLFTVWVMQSKQQKDFENNQQENNELMQRQSRAMLDLQRVQNEQSKNLLWQLDKAQRLPANGSSLLMTGDDIFMDLED